MVCSDWFKTSDGKTLISAHLDPDWFSTRPSDQEFRENSADQHFALWKFPTVYTHVYIIINLPRCDTEALILDANFCKDYRDKT